MSGVAKDSNLDTRDRIKIGHGSWGRIPILSFYCETGSESYPTNCGIEREFKYGQQRLCSLSKVFGLPPAGEVAFHHFFHRHRASLPRSRRLARALHRSYGRTRRDSEFSSASPP